MSAELYGERHDAVQREVWTSGARKVPPWDCGYGDPFPHLAGQERYMPPRHP